MRHRPFGKTGLQVSELVFGGGWVGGILIHQDDETKLAALRLALDAGINWVDTAPSYGDGRSEQALGWLLREVDAVPHLSTKVRLDLSDLRDIPGQVERSFERSLERLRREEVDLLQLHNPIAGQTTERAIGIDRVLGKGGVADALERLREQGATKYIGITALGEAAACKDVIASGRFDSAQVYYNLLNPSAGQAMPAGWSGQDFSRLLETCREHGVAAMVIRVLAAGVLASELRHGRESQITEGAELASEEARARAVFEALGDRYGTRAQSAIRFALANPDVSCVLVGMAELSHLEEALAAAELGPLPQDALDRLQPLYARNFNRRW